MRSTWHGCALQAAREDVCCCCRCDDKTMMMLGAEMGAAQHQIRMGMRLGLGNVCASGASLGWMRPYGARDG